MMDSAACLNGFCGSNSDFVDWKEYESVMYSGELETVAKGEMLPNVEAEERQGSKQAKHTHQKVGRRCQTRARRQLQLLLKK